MRKLGAGVVASPPLRRIPKRYLRRLPRRVAVPVLTATGWPRAHIEDRREFAVPEPFRLEAYWLHFGDDEGPAYSLFHGPDEILRVDCLQRSPHVHYGLAESRHRGPAEARVYLPPASPTDQVDRATFELAHNVGYCTGLHRRRSVRMASIDEEAFGRAAAEVGDHLRELVARHGP
jgi:hypothetical protein